MDKEERQKEMVGQEALIQKVIMRQSDQCRLQHTALFLCC